MSNRYEITSLIGEDRRGQVFLAQDVTLQRKVAFRKFKSKKKEASKDELEKLGQYTGKLCALQHPNLLTIYDIGSNDEGHYMVTQHIETEELVGRLAEGALNVAGVYNMASDLLDALHAVHLGEIVHGALLTKSIQRIARVRGGHRYLIVDLGLDRISAVVGGVESKRSELLMIAPELLSEDAECSVASDLFALGQLCYISLVGGHPMSAFSKQELEKAYQSGVVPHLKDYAPDVQLDFADWVMGLLTIDPEGRPESTQEAMVSLHAISLNVPQPNVPGVTQAVVEVAPSVTPQMTQSFHVDETAQPVGVMGKWSALASNSKIMIGLALVSLVVIILFVTLSENGNVTEDSDNLASLTHRGPVFLQEVKSLTSLKGWTNPSTVILDTDKILDWTLIKGVPTSSKRAKMEGGSYITSVSTRGGYKEFKMPRAWLKYDVNGKLNLPRSGMTNVERGLAEFGHGWDVMLRMPKKHSGPVVVSFIMMQDGCDFDFEVQLPDSKDAVSLKVPASSPRMVKIPIYIQKPLPSGFYTFKIISSSGDLSRQFSMGLSAIQVERP